MVKIGDLIQNVYADRIEDYNYLLRHTSPTITLHLYSLGPAEN